MELFCKLAEMEFIFFCQNSWNYTPKSKQKPLTVWITTNCGKFLERWEYQTTYLPPEKPVCRSRNNSQNRTWNNRLVPKWKGVCQGCILSPCLFNLCSEYVMRNPKLDETQVEIKIARRYINNLRYTDDTTLMAESKEELKIHLIKVKEESEKAGLKFNIQTIKIMASKSHHFMANRWRNNGKSERLYFGRF